MFTQIPLSTIFDNKEVCLQECGLDEIRQDEIFPESSGLAWKTSRNERARKILEDSIPTMALFRRPHNRRSQLFVASEGHTSSQC